MRSPFTSSVIGFIGEGPEVPSEDGISVLLLSIEVGVVAVSSVFKMEEKKYCLANRYLSLHISLTGLHLICDQILPGEIRKRD